MSDAPWWDDPRLSRDLALAVHEVVANAREHGEPPVEVRITGAGGRGGGEVEVLVRDGGRGPATLGPPALAAGQDAERGRGRWLAHHLAVVDERRTVDGFEVRLRSRPEGSGASAEPGGGAG